MPYIGKQLVRGQNRELDDISSSFNGATTTFNLTVAGDSVTPGSALQLFISVNGVLQNPNTDFTVAGNQITFSTAPGSGLSFFGYLQGDAVDFNTPADGSVTTAKLGSNLTINVADGSFATPSIQFNGSGTDTGFYSPGADEVAITTGGTGRLVIDSSGNVGIGTTSPGCALDIVSQTIPQFRVRYTSGGNYVSLLHNDSDAYLDTTAGGLVFRTSTSTERARIDSSGRLLINPATLIDLDPGSGTTYPKIQIAEEGNNNENALTIVHADDDTAVSGRLVFARSGGTTVARTLPNNDTKLGSTDYLLYDGSAWQTACRMYVTTKKPGSGDAPGRFFLQVTPDGTTTPVTRIYIDEDGDTMMSGVYAATTPNAANVFVASSGQLLRSTSSIKYKTNVETLEDQYADSILNCRPVWYQSTSEIDNPDWGWWGFIAEEVAQIDPRLVHWKTSEVVDDVEVPCDPEPEGVQYDRFVPHLVNLIKRQKEQIEALEARLSALESN
jgi:hypothetical protein